MMKEFVIDLFCGAGGTSSGVHLSKGAAKVIACVNHDAKAIESHRLNHPECKHFIEDIRNPEVVWFLKLRVDALRKLHPDCIITLWASLECTNFSKAKGGLSRDADSRTLADHLFMYLDALKPDYLMIENVREFMDWGPLRIKEAASKSKKNQYCALTPDPKSKNKAIKFSMVPVKELKATFYNPWVDAIKSRGYAYDYRLLNSADFGAYTKRIRYFAQFALNELPIAWPEATHAQKPEGKKLKKYKAVKEVLDFSVEGVSIFNRKKPLVENTLKRIYAGLVKFVANGEETFIKKYYSGRPMGKVISTDGPAGTVKCKDGQALVHCNFILKYNSTNKNGSHNPPSTEEPCPTVACQNRLGIATYEFITQHNSGDPKSKVVSVNGPARTVTASGGKQDLVAAQFLQSYYGNGAAHSLENPCPVIPTKDRFGKVETVFIDQQYGQSKPASIERPLATITQNPKFAKVKYLMLNYSGGGFIRTVEGPAATIVNNDKHNLVEAESFIYNPQFSNPGNSVENPCPVIIARQDKKPLGLIICEMGSGFAIPVYEGECETMVKIKKLMAAYGITDVKMRMLLVEELLRIQGFPPDYELVGNQTDRKKFIGNSVEVKTATALFDAHDNALEEHFENLEIAA